MFFLLSKTLNYLVMPFVLVCIAFLVSGIMKNVRWKKRLFWAALGTLLFFSNEFIANEVMKAWEIKTTPFREMSHHKIGIVLTGGTNNKQTPKDRVYFYGAVDRVIHTVQLYKLNLIDRILISGGSGKLVTSGEEGESLQYKKTMIVMGVPESDIMTEEVTRNTYESAIEVKKIITSNGYRDADCLLITSAFHMRRALACYRKAGFQIDNFTTDFYSHPTEYTFDVLFIPNVGAIDIWQRLIREWMGIIAYKIAGYI